MLETAVIREPIMSNHVINVWPINYVKDHFTLVCRLFAYQDLLGFKDFKSLEFLFGVLTIL